MKVERIFVYGTLKPGEVRYNAIKHMVDEESTINGVVEGVSLYNYFNKFPFVDIAHAPGREVKGVLLTIKPEWRHEVINVTDRIEGYPGLFDREYFSVRLPDGLQFRAAVMYYGNSDHLLDNGVLIEDGTW